METKKVSVRFFLNTKLKGENFKGVMFYPLYARINFLETNTSIRVNHRSGNPIMIDEAEFKELLDFVEFGKYPVEILYKTGARHVLNRKELIEKSVLWEYSKMQDRFDFKMFTKKFKRWEQDISHVMQDAFSAKAKKNAFDSIKKLETFQSIDFEQIMHSDIAFKSWIDALGGIKKIDNDLREFAECVHALLYFNRYLFNVKLRYEPSLSYYPTERSTVFSWENGADKNDFVEYTHKAIQNLDSYTYWLTKPFAEAFPPNEKRLDTYVKIIDSVIKSIEIS